MGGISTFTLAIMVMALILLFSMCWVLREHERGVVFMLGRFYKVKGPGLIIVPIIQQMVRVDMRNVVMDVPTQDVISPDNAVVGSGITGLELSDKADSAFILLKPAFHSTFYIRPRRGKTSSDVTVAMILENNPIE